MTRQASARITKQHHSPWLIACISLLVLGLQFASVTHHHDDTTPHQAVDICAICSAISTAGGHGALTSSFSQLQLGKQAVAIAPAAHTPGLAPRFSRFHSRAPPFIA